MKKMGFVLYTIAVLMIGSLIGETIAGNTYEKKRLTANGVTMDVMLTSSDKVVAQVYPPKKIKKLSHLSDYQLIFELE